MFLIELFLSRIRILCASDIVTGSSLRTAERKNAILAEDAGNPQALSWQVKLTKKEGAYYGKDVDERQKATG